MKFQKLKNYIHYQWACQSQSTSIKKTGYVQFPKKTDNNSSKIISFGDWSKAPSGETTYKSLLLNKKDTDAIVFLGDMSYDLYRDNGEVENTFLNWTQELTSSVPFQVSNKN